MVSHAHATGTILAQEFIATANASSATSGRLTLDVQRLLLGDLRLQLGDLLLLLLDLHLELNTVDTAVALNALLCVLQLLNGVQQRVE